MQMETAWVVGAGLKGRKTEQIWQVEVESMQIEREQAWVLEAESHVGWGEDFHDPLHGSGWLSRRPFLP